MRRLLFCPVAAACVVGGFLMEGGHSAMLFHLNTFVIVFGPVAAYFLCVPGAVESLRINSEPDPLAQNHIYRAMTIGLLAGTSGLVFGTIQVLVNISQTPLIGSGMAVALMSLLYGCAVAVFLFPFLPLGNSGKFLKTAGVYAVTALTGVAGLMYLVTAAIRA